MKREIYKNKHGWIRIVEAFVAILIILGVVLVFIGNSQTVEDDSQKIYKIQNSILDKIQNNETLRSEVVATTIAPLSSFDNGFPIQTNNTVNSNTPNFLSCSAKICDVGKPCISEEASDKSIYTKSILISSDQVLFQPKKLSLFCFKK